jgi:YesN/AraC family two-component response regulator
MEQTKITKNITILYVEDDKVTRTMFSDMFVLYFKTVHIATNGKEGVEKFTQFRDEIDCVITDINMPFMDGLKMARMIKRRNYYVPIIVLSAFGDVDWLKRAVSIGVNGYFTKPINPKKIIESVVHIVELHNKFFHNEAEDKENNAKLIKINSMLKLIKDKATLECIDSDIVDVCNECHLLAMSLLHKDDVDDSAHTTAKKQNGITRSNK